MNTTLSVAATITPTTEVVDIEDFVKIVVADDQEEERHPLDANVITATSGFSTEQQKQQKQAQHSNKNKKNNKINASIDSGNLRSCPGHDSGYKNKLPNAINSTAHEPLRTLLFSENSSSGELLSVEAHIDDKISPIFEECDHDYNNDDDDDDDDHEEVDDDDDSEYCAHSRKSTYSIKSSASRYENLMKLKTANQQIIATSGDTSGKYLTSSKSFNDRSNCTNTKLQKLRKMKLETTTTPRWRGKLRIDGKRSNAVGGGEALDEASSSSEKNIVQRALRLLAAGRGKSTSNFRFASNKFNFLHGHHKTKSCKTQQKEVAQKEVAETRDESRVLQAVASSSMTAAATESSSTSNATTTTKINTIISSLLRTTTI